MMTRSGRNRRFLPAMLIIGLLAVSKADAHGGHGGHSGGHAAAGTSLLRGPAGLQGTSGVPLGSVRTSKHRGDASKHRGYTSKHCGHEQTQHGTRQDTGHQHAGPRHARTDPGQQHQIRHARAPPRQGLPVHPRTPRSTRQAPHPTVFPRIPTLTVPVTVLATIGPTATVTVTATVVTEEATATVGPRATTARSSARLRSVHASLARIDHDYQGHRVSAMRSVSMAIRQLSHRSMGYSGTGFSSGMNNGRAMGMRQGGGGVNARQSPASAHVPGPIRRPDEPEPADLAGDQHAARAARGTTPRAMARQADTSSGQSTS